MLRSNDLIDDKDIARLESWIDCMSYAVLILLDGGGIKEAFAEYRRIKLEARRS